MFAQKCDGAWRSATSSSRKQGEGAILIVEYEKKIGEALTKGREVERARLIKLTKLGKRRRVLREPKSY